MAYVVGAQNRKLGRKEGREERKEEGSKQGAYSQDPEFWSFLELSASAAFQTIPLCRHGNNSDKTMLAKSLLLRALCPSQASSQRKCFGDQDTGLKVRREI